MSDEIVKYIPDEVARAIATSMGWESAIAEPSGMERFKGHIASGLAAWPRMAKLEAGRISPSGLFIPLEETLNDQG